MLAVEQIKGGKSYLIWGQADLEILKLIRDLAKRLICKEKKDFVLFEANTHPDFYFLDGNESNGIKAISELREFLKLRPISDLKVVLIKDIHLFTLEALNALLKILEEPPSNLIIFLTATNLGPLPETITSRCEIFEIRKLISIKVSKEDIDFFSKLVKSSISERFLKTKNLDLEEKLDSWIQILRILFKSKIKADSPPKELEELAKFYDFKKVSSLLALFYEAKKLLKTNVNKKLLLENLVLKL